MKSLKQRVTEINFQPIPITDPDSDMIAFEGEDGWWLGKTQDSHLFYVARNASATRLGGFTFFMETKHEKRTQQRTQRRTRRCWLGW